MIDNQPTDDLLLGFVEVDDHDLVFLHARVQYREILPARVDGRVDREIAHFDLLARWPQTPLIRQLD